MDRDVIADSVLECASMSGVMYGLAYLADPDTGSVHISTELLELYAECLDRVARKLLHLVIGERSETMSGEEAEAD